MDDSPLNIITGQVTSEGKLVRSRQLRRSPTETEQILWKELRANKLGVHFRRQQIILGFIADFYCSSARLVVEVDGPIHSTEYDFERDACFHAIGITVLRFQNGDVQNNLPLVLSTIQSHLK